MKGRGSSRHEEAVGGCDDRATIWGKRGGEWGRRGGTEEKPMPTDGIEGGELIDLLSVSSSEDQWQTEAPVFII